MMESPILLTGATAISAAVLLKRFEANTIPCVVIVGDLKCCGHAWYPELRFLPANLLNPDSLKSARGWGPRWTYYLVPNPWGRLYGFEEMDRKAAENFAGAAQALRGI